MSNWIPSNMCKCEMVCPEYDYIYNDDGEVIDEVMVSCHTYCGHKDEYDQDCSNCDFNGSEK